MGIAMLAQNKMKNNGNSLNSISRSSFNQDNGNNKADSC